MTLINYNLIKGCDLSQEIFDQCYLLVREIRPLYIASSLGWSKRQKIDEMQGEGMWYLIATKDHQEPSTRGGAGVSWTTSQRQEQVIGFASFMLDDVDSMDNPCVYLYEMHVKKKNHRQGIGSELMRRVIELAQEKYPETGQVNLTVFDFNEKARTFYEKYGFNLVDLEDQRTHCLELMRQKGI